MKTLLFTILLGLTMAQANASEKIVGGVPVKLKDYPFIVSVDDLCGGMVIDKHWVMTAAHCLPVNRIRGGSDDLDASGMKSFTVVNQFIHPDENFEQHDIALIKVKEDLTKDTGLRAIQTAKKSHVKSGAEKPGVLAKVIGWGDVLEGGPGSRILRGVDVPLVSNEVANKPEAYDGQVKKWMLAAGLAAGGKDACQGDSGGPLFSKLKDNSFVLIGVVSWGIGCARPNKYGVYARVSFYQKWIEETMRAN